MRDYQYDSVKSKVNNCPHLNKQHGVIPIHTGVFNGPGRLRLLIYTMRDVVMKL